MSFNRRNYPRRHQRRNRGLGSRSIHQTNQRRLFGEEPPFGARGYWGYMGNSPIQRMFSRFTRNNVNMDESDSEEIYDSDDSYLNAMFSPAPLENGTPTPISNDRNALSRLLQTQACAIPGSLEPGGYPEEMFLELTDEEKEQYECKICFHILRDPKECRNGHIFCGTCIDRWSVSQPMSRSSCPICRTNGSYGYSKDVDRKILKQEVKCPQDGCEWTGILRDYKTHGREKHKDTVCSVEGFNLRTDQGASINDLRMVNNMDSSQMSTLGQTVEILSSHYNNEDPLPARDVENSETTMARARISQDRLMHNRQRIQAMLENVRSEISHNQARVEQFYNDRQQHSISPLQEVLAIGYQLSDVSEGISGLLDEMRTDTIRYNESINNLQQMDDIQNRQLEGVQLPRPRVSNAERQRRPTRQRRNLHAQADRSVSLPERTANSSLRTNNINRINDSGELLGTPRSHELLYSNRIESRMNNQGRQRNNGRGRNRSVDQESRIIGQNRERLPSITRQPNRLGPQSNISNISLPRVRHSETRYNSDIVNNDIAGQRREINERQRASNPREQNISNTDEYLRNSNNNYNLESDIPWRNHSQLTRHSQAPGNIDLINRLDRLIHRTANRD